MQTMIDVSQTIFKNSKNSDKNYIINHNITDEQEILIENDMLKTNYFNNFFSTIDEKMDGSIEKNNYIPTVTENNTINESLFLYPVTENELILIINNLNNNTASRLDNISVATIKKYHKYLITSLVHIIKKGVSLRKYIYSISMQGIVHHPDS